MSFYAWSLFYRKIEYNHTKIQGGFRKNKRQKHSLICNDYKQNRPQTESAILRFLQYLKNKNSHHKLPDKTF